MVAPRLGSWFGGIEFSPGEAERIVLVGDETAVPAVARILADLPVSARGVALVEVPCAHDFLPLQRPPGMEVCWLSRTGASPGERLLSALGALVPRARRTPAIESGGFEPGGLESEGLESEGFGAGSFGSDELWETATFSSSGEALDHSTGAGAPRCSTGQDYFWIAGEAGLVRSARALLRPVGLRRDQAAYMGYWRRESG